jgi:5-hydroxyisourate hydrolase
VKTIALSMTLALAFSPVPAAAAEISTHVLDLARGVGGVSVPVILSKRDASGAWLAVAEAKTDGNGRVRSFGDTQQFGPGTYRLQFDLTAYPDATATPFFPEIALAFNVSDAAGHYHVPVVVSPYGYSTYRGN